MAITLVETQVTWPTAANSKSVAANSNETSEEVNLDATCIAAQISLKADAAGTPAADDYINFYMVQTSGDPDGAGADEFDTIGHARFLAKVDTNIEDPAGKTVPLPIPQKGFKIVARGDHTDTSTAAITVSAAITEQRLA